MFKKNIIFNEFNAFCLENGIKKIRTTPYHPQCNGLAERSVKTIKSMLATYVSEEHDDWDVKLSAVVFAYNNKIQSSTGYAPNQVIYGRLLPTPSDRKLGIEPPVIEANREEIERNIGDKIKKAQERQKKAYDEKVRDKIT